MKAHYTNRSINGTMTIAGFGPMPADVCEYMQTIAKSTDFDWAELRSDMLNLDDDAEDTSSWNWFSGVRRDAQLEPAPVTSVLDLPEWERIAELYETEA